MEEAFSHCQLLMRDCLDSDLASWLRAVRRKKCKHTLTISRPTILHLFMFQNHTYASFFRCEMLMAWVVTECIKLESNVYRFTTNRFAFFSFGPKKEVNPSLNPVPSEIGWVHFWNDCKSLFILPSVLQKPLTNRVEQSAPCWKSCKTFFAELGFVISIYLNAYQMSSRSVITECHFHIDHWNAVQGIIASGVNILSIVWFFFWWAFLSILEYSSGLSSAVNEKQWWIVICSFVEDTSRSGARCRGKALLVIVKMI